MSEVPLLGHLVGINGIRPNPQKLEALQTAKAPLNKSKLRSSLGTASYLRRFTPNFSKIVDPLNMLMKKRVPWYWGESQDRAFGLIKQELSDGILLSAPRGPEHFVIVCDASVKGIGSVNWSSIIAALRWRYRNS